MKYEAVLFDFDGTLADSNELINRSHLSVLEEYYPGMYTLESVRQFNGPSLDEVYGRLDWEEKDTMIAKYREYNAIYHDEMIRLFDGVTEQLHVLKEKGMKLAVVSTKRNDTLWKGIKLLGLDGLFDVVIGGEDYTYYKPNPEPIYRAMAELNCLHEKTMMVGDNFHDIEAANNAGILSVFVGWSQKTREEIAPYGPDCIVDTMEELTDLVLDRSRPKVS